MLNPPHKPGEPMSIGMEGTEVGFLTAFATTEKGVADFVFKQILNILHPDGDMPLTDDVVDLAVALIAELQPESTVEAMLVSQMIAAQVGAMETMRRGLRRSQTHGAAQSYVGLSGKLMRTFTGQVDTLNRGRGKGVTQRVVVERVNVEPGAQAVVGAVAAPGGGRGS